MNKQYLNKKASISYLQIILLLIASFAIPYLISQSVQAQIPGEVCCEETNPGNSCQNTQATNCNPEFKVAPTTCETTDFCEIGCCISSENGLCSKRTSERDCSKIDGIFESEALCQVNPCELGCCVLGSETKWTTEKNCQFEGNSQNKDIPTEWLTDEDHNTDIKCKFSSQKQNKGACTYNSNDEKKCVYETLEECVSRTGSLSNFFDGTICSNPELETICKAKDHQDCLEGEEDIYWFDSCNNQEEIAEDCSLLDGTYCEKDSAGKTTCKDVNCNDIGKRHGESWCEYDGRIGNGKDPVGSRHIKHICYMGSERIEPCADFRNEICVQDDSAVDSGSFSQASCRANQWRSCLNINQEGGAEKITSACEKNPDCRVKSINMGGSFAFTVCLPNYPPGFELIDRQQANNVLNDDGSINEQAYATISPGNSVCSMSTKRCTTTWMVGLFCPGCVDNCKCHTNAFTEEMNDFCTSLGDCGGSINYVGEYTDSGYSVKSTGGGTPGRIAGDTSNTYEGTPADPGNFEFYQTMNPELLRKKPKENSSSTLSSFEQELLQVAGAYGSPLLLKMLQEGDENESKWVSGVSLAGMQGVNYARYTGGFSNAISSAISQQMTPYDAKEPQDFSMIAAMIAGAIAFLITSSILMTMMAAMMAFLLFMPCIMVTYNIDFTCSSWEPPNHGSKCEECNKIDPPCSEYKCESLGELCQFINKGTDNELCVDIPEDKSYPLIQPLQSVITEGYEYKDITENGFEVVDSRNKGCIDAYTTVRFGIKVDPFARCRLGTEPSQSYDEMSDLFGPKGNMLLPVHRMDLFFPSPDAFKNQYNLTEESITQLGKLDYFIKCKTASGKINPETYKIKSCINPGPDLTAPIINPLTSPKNKAHLKYGTTNQSLKIYINEPSECKWDTREKEFTQMENQFNCEKDLTKYTLFGLPCTTTLTNLQNNTKFYFKCKDQPWWKDTENETKRNTMEESFEYELLLSKNPLIIDEFLPRQNQIITEGFEPVSTTLKLTTEGGAENGQAICSYKLNEFSLVNLIETNDTVHTQEFQSLMKGDYKIEFICQDIAGNQANQTTNFKVQIDNQGPRIIRIYYESGLKVITSEPAECRYDFTRKFIFENATSMYTKNELEHFGEWELKNYYIQCQDEYENKGSKLKVKGYEIF
jgi:hypothetical protein